MIKDRTLQPRQASTTQVASEPSAAGVTQEPELKIKGSSDWPLTCLTEHWEKREKRSSHGKTGIDPLTFCFHEQNSQNCSFETEFRTQNDVSLVLFAIR